MAEALPRERRVLSPTQLNTLARELLEGTFAQVWIEGEISNFARPASGHLYFTLKDENAQVRCAMFRMKASALRFAPRNGLKVLVRGRLTLYEARGEFQLVLEHMEEAGEGALRRAFEELKARLAAEGLFEPARKRPLPRFARHLGLVTSARGAAVRDVLTVLSRRWPLLWVDVLPVAVQGAAAAGEIRAMLERAAASGRYDVILLTRGGGSLEDLWSFNDEALARAIAASAVPVVSAVGHEIDFSLSDFAADLRAATPSAAAELLVPDRAELSAQLRQLRGRLDAAMQRRLGTLAQRSDRAGLRLEGLRPQLRLERARHRLAVLGQRLGAGMQRRLELRGQRVELLARTLASVSPLATLARGYAVLREHDSGRVLRRAADARPGQQLDAQLGEGRLSLRVEGEPPA
jgi:exodeoxyribonuclease VII large subunit